MPLNQSDIDELRQIYSEEFGEELSNEEAWERRLGKRNLFQILAKRSGLGITQEQKAIRKIGWLFSFVQRGIVVKASLIPEFP